MDKFIVSARKYRPQTFDTVVGQDHITTTLKNAIRNHQLAHAFLFCGPRGVGKTTCARILAKTINCEQQQPDGEACNSCQSCTSFNEGTSMNIHELDAASNNSVDDIRSLVEQVRFAPQAGKYKVYIIDEVHMLSTAAFNAFLKTLEEPPGYAIFILATTEKHKIIPTILSRCQIFDFKRITLNDTVLHLREIAVKENIKAEKAALQVIAQKSEGCMRDALSLMDKIVSFTNSELTYVNTLEHLNILDADYYFRMLDCMLTEDLAGALILYDDINKKGFEGDMVINGLSEFIRNLLVSKDEKVASLLEVVESFRERYMETASKASAGYLISALNILNESEINFKAARNKRLHVELTLIKLTYLRQAIDLSTRNIAEEKKKADYARPVAFRNIAALQPVHSPIKKRPKEQEQAENFEARLQIEETVKVEATRAEINTEPVAVAEKTTIVQKVGLLQSIRDQYASKQINTALQMIALSTENLQEEWKLYTQNLRERKNPAAESFERARLHVLSDQSFEVVCNNNLEQKFIEQEKRQLCEYMQETFRNKALHIQISIGDNTSQEKEEDRPLNKREQYQKIVEQYPLVKELRDRLKLELDY
jgi:DNA polymerase-3 subunit gamma/tau